MYYPGEMKAQVSPVQWSKPHSILVLTQDSNPGGRIQNHKRWSLDYHCTLPLHATWGVADWGGLDIWMVKVWMIGCYISRNCLGLHTKQSHVLSHISSPSLLVLPCWLYISVSRHPIIFTLMLKIPKPSRFTIPHQISHSEYQDILTELAYLTWADNFSNLAQAYLTWALASFSTPVSLR